MVGSDLIVSMELPRKLKVRLDYKKPLVLVITGLLVLLASSKCLAGQRDHPGDTVNRFLNSWLVNKDISTALRFFDERALSNASIIDDNCPGFNYMPDSERSDSALIRQGVKRFLGDISTSVKGHSLKSILFLESKDDPEQSEFFSSRLRGISFNQVNSDKYYLATISSLKNSGRSGAEWSRIAPYHNLRNAFISVIQFRLLNKDPNYGDDVAVLFVWATSGSQWRIVFATVVSCT